MLSKLIVGLAALCVVKASVIINVFDEDPETSETRFSHLGECNYQDCDQRCRNIGFTGGVCVNGHCKCDINRREVPEITQVLSDLGKSAYPFDCNPQACDQQCRNIGFTGGVCVHDRCKCDINKGDFSLSELEKSAYASDCNPQACDQQCRNIGFTGGVCVHDHCKCDINRKEVPETTKSFAELAKSLYPRDCDILTCDQQCRKFGYPSGFCVDGRCECINSRKEPVSVNDGSKIEEKTRKEGKPSFNLPRACDIFNCNDMCQRLNYVGGMCDTDGVCQCF